MVGTVGVMKSNRFSRYTLYIFLIVVYNANRRYTMKDAWDIEREKIKEVVYEQRYINYTLCFLIGFVIGLIIGDLVI